MLNPTSGRMNKMKSIIISITCMLLLLGASSQRVEGQQSATYPAAEKVHLFTDRTIYITGEELHFSAFLTAVQKLSLVLYVEIVSPDGRSLAQSKFPVDHDAAGGILTIPTDIISGIYYLRAYTKYMRNLGPGAYTYVCIKIVNPLRNEVATGNDTTGYVKEKIISGTTADAYTLSVDNKVFAPRKPVNISVKAAEGIKNGEFCLSVVPEAAYSRSVMQLPVNDSPVTSLRYYPETRGVSVTGELRDNSGEKAVAGARVNLSVVGMGRYFLARETDTNGRYFFSLPAYMGSRDLFICAENTTDTRPKILVDNDFCAEPFHLPSPVFKLTAAERAAAYNMAVNTRLGQMYGKDTIPCQNTDIRPDRAFYGTPTEILNIDKYVQLPTLEEYFNELETTVKVRKLHGKKYFKVLGTQPEMAFYDPLVMVDWVAMDDPDKILAVSPQNIARIEIVNQLYIYGDITYGGIVCFISKHADFGGIDLPTSGIFINYRFLADNAICTADKSDSPVTPDPRNTLFWEPNHALEAGKSTQISFTTPDTPGRYSIILRGINDDGKTFVKTEVFEVKLN
jgi:hypothetical protein